MFRRPSTQLAQTDNASEAVSAEVDDSSECFDDATETTQENGRPHKTRSVSFLLYNVGSVASKLYDCYWVKYVELFDFVTLTETFMDNDFDLSGVFHDFIKFVCPAVMTVLSREAFWRFAGDGEETARFMERVSVDCDSVIVLKLSGALLGTEEDCLFLSTYVPP